MIYLDYNATSKLSPKVEAYLKENAWKDWGNPSSEHDFGYNLNIELKKCRESIAEFLDCEATEFVFTGGGTESINTVLNPFQLKHLGITTVISSQMEHHATLDCIDFLEKQGFSILWVKTTKTGGIDLEHLAKLTSSNPNSLVSLLFVNNETGVINDAKEIRKITSANKCFFHIDGVQALGKMEFSLDDISPDFASFAGHKIGGLKGLGLLYFRNKNEVVPFMRGGGQEMSMRAGTYNFNGIKSLKLAMEDVDFSKIKEAAVIRDVTIAKLRKKFPNFEVNGISEPRVYNTINFSFRGMKSKELMLMLSSKGIYVSTGSACSGSLEEVSHVISQFQPDEIAGCSIRASSHYSEIGNLEVLLEGLPGQPKTTLYSAA